MTNSNQHTKNLTRRGFLNLSAASLTALGLPAWTPRLAFAQTNVEPPADVLICLFLRGGMDALNTVIPQFDPDYYRLRPNLAIPTSVSSDDQTAIDLDGRFGLHPALRPLLDIWNAGELAFVHAAGSPDPTHSHFDAMDYMERGTPGEKSLSTGWIGRHLQSADWENGSLLRAVGMGGKRQTSLHGPVPVTSLQSIAEFHLSGDSAQLLSFQNTLDALYQLDHPLTAPAQDTFGAIDLLSGLQSQAYTPAKNAEYPEGDLGSALKDIAQLVKAQVGLEVACLDMGGFDTHANQGAVEGLLANLLGQLSQGLAAFFYDLHDQGVAYSLVAMSEFGRRAAENGSGGSDHGHGGMMLAMGPGTKGAQVAGEWPGLEDESLYGPGDLAVTTDFRAVLSELVERRLSNGAHLPEIFPDYESAELLDIFKPRDA
jgi:uncharacterized protein (DUF1501 family)